MVTCRIGFVWRDGDQFGERNMKEKEKEQKPYRYTLPYSTSELKRLDGMYERM